MASTTVSYDSDNDYEHWPIDSKGSECSESTVLGFGGRNGLRTHTYHPPEEARESPPPISPVLSATGSSPRTVCSKAEPDEEIEKLTQLPIQYGYATYPAVYAHPAYYAAMPVAAPAPLSEPVKSAKVSVEKVSKASKSSHNGKVFTYQPKESVTKMEKTNYWIGRTTEEVEDDNKKIAAAEKTNQKRKVVPVNVTSDDVFWVLETNNTHTLRTFAGIDGLKGEWKQDRRYESTYYFVVEKGGDDD